MILDRECLDAPSFEASSSIDKRATKLNERLNE